jgi:hypothetical protein
MSTAPVIENLCEKCKKHFAICDGFPTFAEDVHDNLPKKLRDAVLDCTNFSLTTKEASPNKPK